MDREDADEANVTDEASVREVAICRSSLWQQLDSLDNASQPVLRETCECIKDSSCV